MRTSAKNQNIQLFDKWISKNYSKIKEKFSVHQSLDEDCFNDAYIASLRAVKQEQKNKEFLEIFINCYKTAVRKSLSHRMRFVCPDPLFFDFLHDEEVEEGKEAHGKFSYSTVLFYAKHHFSHSDFELFRMNLLNSISCKCLAEYTGKSEKSIYQKIKVMKHSIKSYIFKQYNYQL